MLRKPWLKKPWFVAFETCTNSGARASTSFLIQAASPSFLGLPGQFIVAPMAFGA